MDSLSASDIAAGVCLSLLSFLASVVQGSTSLGDGIFLQITWGILQALVPFATTQSSLGSDGLRVITMLMYVRLAVIPPYLLWRLWRSFKEKQAKDAEKSSETITNDNAGEPTKTVLEQKPKESYFSSRLFWLLAIPNLFWCIVGVFILKRAKSDDIEVYIGSICITFSFVYMGLKMWKASPAKKSMPKWLQTLFSPPFLVEGTTDQITVPAQIATCLAFNLSGLMTTLAGVGGPPMMIVILLFDMPMNLTRFTFPVGTLLGAYIRLFVSLYTGMLDMTLWPFYLPATVMGFIGINVGIGIGNVLTPSMFSATIFCLLILAGIVMLTSNPYITVPCLFVALTSLIVKQFWWDAVRPPEVEVPTKAAPTVPIQMITVASSSYSDSPSQISSSSALQYCVEDLGRHSASCNSEAIVAI